MFDFETLADRNGTGACKWDRRSAGEKAAGIVPMSIADMEFLCAPCVREAVEGAAARGIFGYTDPDSRYFDALCAFLARRHALSVGAGDVLCLHGVVPALSVAVRCYTRPGEGVIVQSPVYYPFGEVVRDNGRVLVENPLVLENGRYRMDLAGLEEIAARKENTLLLLCSPHNPVGRVWTMDELRAMCEICVRHGVTVVSDEIHFDLVLQGEHTPILNVPGMRDKAVLLCSASKSFNVPGLQLASAIIPGGELRALFKRRLNADGYSNISHFGCAAAVAAFEKGDAWLDALVERLRANDRLFNDFLAARFPGVWSAPLEGTYLKWVNFGAFHLPGKALGAFMREKAGLILDDGLIFGPAGEGWERFNIAMPEKALREALSRLDEAAKGIGK